MAVFSTGLLLLLLLDGAHAACDRTNTAADVVCSRGSAHLLNPSLDYWAACFIQGAGVRDPASCPPGWEFEDLGVFKQCVRHTPALDLAGTTSLNECGAACTAEGETIESMCCADTEARIPEETTVAILALVQGRPSAADCPAGWLFQPEWAVGWDPQCLLTPTPPKRLAKIPACGSAPPPPPAPAGSCTTRADCEKLVDCHQPDMVAYCHDNGLCYTGTLDARCTDQPNADQPGSPELGDGGWCWGGRRDQHCVGVLSPPPSPPPSRSVSSVSTLWARFSTLGTRWSSSPTTLTAAMPGGVHENMKVHETIKAWNPRGEDEGHHSRRTDKLLIGLICAVVVVGAGIIGAVLFKMKPRSAVAMPSIDTALVAVPVAHAVALAYDERPLKGLNTAEPPQSPRVRVNLGPLCAKE